MQDSGSTEKAIDEIGEEIIEMNVKMEKMSDLITACYEMLRR